MHIKNTKIVCTLGPSSNSVTEISELVSAGMNVARLNFSHGDYASHLEIINNLRKIEKISGHTVGILQDLQGPKIRLGQLPNEGMELKRGAKIILTTKTITGKKNLIPISYPTIRKDVKKGERILINDGLIELKIEKLSGSEVYCRVVVGGIAKSRNGVNIPNSKLSIPAITEKDKKDLAFGLKNNVDFVALSFVRSPKDILELRKLIKLHKKNTPIIAKIEHPEALTELEKIIEISDGVMVARGDLGVNLPPEQVPIVQKRVIALANKHAKPVITATQVLNSMINSPTPTRAEVSDAANAVFDHTDCIMLSNETSIGKYPAKAVAVLTRVSSTVEKELKKDRELLSAVLADKRLSPIDAYCLSACETALETNADFIAVYTESGYTARQIAKYRIYIPIIVVTPRKKTARELSLVWGLNRIFVKSFTGNPQNKSKRILEYLKKIKQIASKDKVITVFNI